MKATLFTVALFLVSHLSNSQRILEVTNGSWDNQNLSVETFADFVITGFTETNPATGLLTPTFKISNTLGGAITSYHVDFPDAMYLMDFTIRESTQTIVLTGMTTVTAVGTPYKMYVAEVDFMTGAMVQSTLEYPSTSESMIPHQVIVSESTNQVAVVGTKISGTMTNSNFASVSKRGFLLRLNINNYNTILMPPIQMNTPSSGTYDYDMLENITEVPGFGYFISGSANNSAGEQNLLITGVDYGGGVAYSRIIDNTNFRHAGSSVMYNAALNVVYVLTNNSVIHQFQIAQCNPTTGALTSWVSHQFTALPIGSGADQNGFHLQQTPSGFIIVGGYISTPSGALPQLLTPFQVVMRNNLAFSAAKLYESDNNSPLSPSYFEENGNSVVFNTPNMIAYNEIENRTYLVNQNTNYGGVDLNVSSLFKTSECEKAMQVTTFTNPPQVVGSASFSSFSMYPSPYSLVGNPRPIQEYILCQSVAPAIAAGPSHPSVYPNPASDQVNITLADETIQDVTVYDLKGNLVFAQKANERDLNIVTLEVGKLNSGAYILEINTKSGNIYHEKFVKE